MYCFYHVAHIISHQLRDETRMTSSLKALQIGTIEFDISEFFWRHCEEKTDELIKEDLNKTIILDAHHVHHVEALQMR